jgi:hypothetical protein
MEPTATSRTGSSLPDTMRAFVLDGQWFDHAGTRFIETPRPGPGQIVGRVDAAGICSFVNNVIAQGTAHTLTHGWDLVAHPAILGRRHPSPIDRERPSHPGNVLGAGYFSM